MAVVTHLPGQQRTLQKLEQVSEKAHRMMVTMTVGGGCTDHRCVLNRPRTSSELCAEGTPDTGETSVPHCPLVLGWALNLSCLQTRSHVRMLLALAKHTLGTVDCFVCKSRKRTLSTLCKGQRQHFHMRHSAMGH